MKLTNKRCCNIGLVLLSVFTTLWFLSACDTANLEGENRAIDGEVELTCPVPQLLCNGLCVDPSTSIENCGACNSGCEEGSSCSEGLCLSPDGTQVEPVVGQPGPCAAAQADCEQSCTGTDVLCAGACVNLQEDTSSCGACGEACAEGEVCNAGACVCSAASTLCDGACADLNQDTAHCGACNNVCAGNQICNAGSCECASGQILCEQTCADTQTDALNCGACGAACENGSICTSGICDCPVEHALCDGTCIDTATDVLNCGTCGTECGLGQQCQQGTCVSGAMGADTCSGLAQGIEISKVSLYQTIEVPIVEDGNEVTNRNVDVVAGRPTLVRVFADVAEGWQPRNLSARLFLDDGETRATLYTAAPQRVQGPSFDTLQDGTFEQARASTFEFKVDALTPNDTDNVTLKESTRYAIELVECGAAPGAPLLSPRFPAEGDTNMRAVNTGTLHVTFVPLRVNGITAPATEAELQSYLTALRTTYPTASVEHSIRAPYTIQNPNDWVVNLDALTALRAQDRAAPNTYYYGLLKPTEQYLQFCGNGCVRGVSFIATDVQASQFRVGIGLAYLGRGERTLLHELGHSHGRAHAPCDPAGTIDAADPNFPYTRGTVGVRGYNGFLDTIMPATLTDVMGYCEDFWFSDYTYGGLLNWMYTLNNTSLSVQPDPARLGDFHVLLLSKGQPASWGRPISRGIARGKAESARILDKHGTVIENVRVYRTEVSHIKAFSIQVPAPKAHWHSVQLVDHAPVAF